MVSIALADRVNIWLKRQFTVTKPDVARAVSGQQSAFGLKRKYLEKFPGTIRAGKSPCAHKRDFISSNSTLPREEYGLTSQIRYACAHVPTNIAEGCGRNNDAELARFLEIAMGSTSELEYLLLLTHDLKLLDVADYHRFADDVTEVKRMLASFIMKLRAGRC